MGILFAVSVAFILAYSLCEKGFLHLEILHSLRVTSPMLLHFQSSDPFLYYILLEIRLLGCVLLFGTMVLVAQYFLFHLFFLEQAFIMTCQNLINVDCHLCDICSAKLMFHSSGLSYIHHLLCPLSVWHLLSLSLFLSSPPPPLSLTMSVCPHVYLLLLSPALPPLHPSLTHSSWNKFHTDSYWLPNW